jgi:hypothetical protein
MTVAQFLQDWLDRKSRLRKASTLSGYRGVIESHLVPALGRHRLTDLRPSHVQGMLDRIAVARSLRVGPGREHPVVRERW